MPGGVMTRRERHRGKRLARALLVVPGAHPRGEEMPHVTLEETTGLA